MDLNDTMEIVKRLLNFDVMIRYTDAKQILQTINNIIAREVTNGNIYTVRLNEIVFNELDRALNAVYEAHHESIRMLNNIRADDELLDLFEHTVDTTHTTVALIEEQDIDNSEALQTLVDDSIDELINAMNELYCKSAN